MSIEREQLKLVEISNKEDLHALLPLLRDADEDDAHVLSTILRADHTTYAAYLPSSPNKACGAVTMKWPPAVVEEDDDSEAEIVYIAVSADARGQGIGKRIIRQIIRIGTLERTTKVLMVGTANSSIDNLAFYQKCGFRMDSIKKNYFDYIQPPVYENGIQVSDMVVMKMIL